MNKSFLTNIIFIHLYNLLLVYFLRLNTMCIQRIIIEYKKQKFSKYDHFLLGKLKQQHETYLRFVTLIIRQQYTAIETAIYTWINWIDTHMRWLSLWCCRAGKHIQKLSISFESSSRHGIDYLSNVFFLLTFISIFALAHKFIVCDIIFLFFCVFSIFFYRLWFEMLLPINGTIKFIFSCYVHF